MNACLSPLRLVLSSISHLSRGRMDKCIDEFGRPCTEARLQCRLKRASRPKDNQANQKCRDERRIRRS